MSGRSKMILAAAALLLVAVSVVGTLFAVRIFGGSSAGALGELFGVISEHALHDVSEEELYLSAARGTVAGLNDDYAAYYTAEEYEKNTESKSGHYEGVGITISYDEAQGYVVVLVTEDGPASRAGIAVGDVILAVNGTAVSPEEGKDPASLISALGEEEFEMELRRGGETYTVRLQCEEIVTHRVQYELLEDGIAYISISAFYADAQGEFAEAIEQAQADGAHALVLDLRGNLGGYLDQMMGVADCLLGSRVVLTVKNGDGTENVYRADGTELDWPMAVLVNSNTASASEALSGALQDYGKAVLVGTQTFGKGIVQTTYPLAQSGGWVKMTTGAYYTPNGRSIHEVGLTPDYVVENSQEGSDAQLEAAMTHLLEELGQN